MAVFRWGQAEHGRLADLANSILLTSDTGGMRAAIAATAPADLRKVDVLFRNLLARRRNNPTDDAELIPAVEQRLQALYHWRTRSPQRRPSYLTGERAPFLADERLRRLVNTTSAAEFAALADDFAAVAGPDVDELLGQFAGELAADLSFPSANLVERRRRMIAAPESGELEFGDGAVAHENFLAAAIDFETLLATLAETGDTSLLDAVVAAIPELVEHRSWSFYIEERRIPLLEGCANAATLRFETWSEPDDILLAVRLNAQLLEEIAVDDPRRAGYCANLGNSFRRRFRVTDDLTDLDDAVATLEYAADLCGQRGSVAPLVCSVLAGALLLRHTVADNDADLVRAVAAAELAVRRASRSDPEYPTYFFDLSAVLVVRYHRDGDPADLERARAMAGKALRAVEEKDPRRAMYADHVKALAHGPPPLPAPSAETDVPASPIDDPAPETGPPGLCPICGAASIALRHPGPIVSAVDNDAASLLELLSDEPQVHCEVCGTVLPVRPAMIALMVGPDGAQPRLALQIAAPGTFHLRKDDYRRLADAATYVDRFVQQTNGNVVVQSGIEVITKIVDSVDEVIAEVAASVDHRLQIVYAVTEDPQGLPGRWRELTGAVFTTADLLTDTEIQGPHRQLTEIDLDSLQLTVWQELAAFWSTPSPDPRLLFDSDLGNYVRRQPSPRAVQRFCALPPPAADYFAVYAYQALRATICTAAGIPNDLNDQWATVYLLNETSRGPITVSRSRARATIGIDSARRAVTGLLITHADRAAPTFEHDLRRATTDLGFDHLVDVVAAALTTQAPATDRDAVLAAADAFSAAGATDRALAVLEAARARGSGVIEDFDAQYTYAALLSENDCHAEALAAMVRAENMALDAQSRLLSRYAQAKLHLHVGGRDRAVEILTTEPAPGRESPRWARTVLLQALTWRNVLTLGPAPAGSDPLLDAVDTALAGITEPADAHSEAVALRAGLAELRGTGAAPELYARADALRRGQRVGRDPVELLELARAAYRSKDLPAARELVAEIPAATASWLGTLDDPALVAGRLRPFSARLGELARDAIGTDWKDLLTIGELQRDTVYRLRSASSGVLDAGDRQPVDLSEAGLRRLAQPEGTLAVVEWLNVGLGRRTDGFAVTPVLVCTMILPNLGVGGRIQAAAEIPANLDHTVRRVRAKLAAWHAARAGDPLDMPEWQEAAAWMRAVLAPAEIGDAHVVFIEHPLYLGAPWHTAIAGNWTASYANSWQEIHDLVARPRRRPTSTLGVLVAPRFNEPPHILAAMHASVARSRELAGPTLLTTEPERNDHHWFHHLLTQADLVKILCHGFVSATDQEVCLTVAHDGKLPTSGSTAATSHDRGHRLSWRDCHDLHDAKATVFSAACSSASSFSTAAGDRLGLFPALRRSGVPALVAPGWDALAVPTIDILDNVIDLYTAGRPLAQAVRQAGRTAADRDLSPWIARSLAVEGDWR